MLECVLEVLMRNEDNKIREINCQEILDELRARGLIDDDEYDRLWHTYLPPT